MEKREAHSLRENPSTLSHSPKARDTNQERATNCIGSLYTPPLDKKPLTCIGS